MNISLTPVLESYVKSKVESGLYNSASEVIRESLRALQEKEIDAKIQIGMDQAKAGLGVPMDQNLIKELQQELQAKKKARQNEG